MYAFGIFSRKAGKSAGNSNLTKLCLTFFLTHSLTHSLPRHPQRVASWFTWIRVGKRFAQTERKRETNTGEREHQHYAPCFASARHINVDARRGEARLVLG